MPHPLLHTLLQTLVDGVAVGSLYALIALGYTLVFGILQFINFAHGDVFALGTWVSLVAATRLIPHLPGPLVAVVVPVAVVGTCAALGFAIEQFAYRPLRNAPRLNVLITAIGVSLLLENTGQLPWAFSTQPRAVPPLIQDRVLATVANVDLRLTNAAVLIVAVVLMAGLQVLIYKTKFGTAMRAVSFNPKAAALMGIHVDRVISGTFVLGSALAGAAGYLYAVKYQTNTLQPTAAAVWVLLGMKAFVAAVVGGIGNVRGAMLGGLLIGVFEMAGMQAGNVIHQLHWTANIVDTSQYRDVYVFALLILVLLVRPSGLLGRATVEKV